MPGLIARIAGFDQWKLEGHRKLLTEKMSNEEWISKNTDDPMCPLARVYNREEAATLFSQFQDIRQEVWEFNVEHWSFLGRAIPDSMAKWIGRNWGWHRMIYGRKI